MDLQGPGWRAVRQDGWDHFIVTVWLDPTVEGEYPGHSDKPHVTRFVTGPLLREQKDIVIARLRLDAYVLDGRG